MGVMGQLGLLWGASQVQPERASGVWLLKSEFRYLHYENRQRRVCFNAAETASPSPNRGHLTKEGPWVPWVSWGNFGVLRFRPERASGVWLLEANFRYLH